MNWICLKEKVPIFDDIASDFPPMLTTLYFPFFCCSLCYSDDVEFENFWWIYFLCFLSYLSPLSLMYSSFVHLFTLAVFRSSVFCARMTSRLAACIQGQVCMHLSLDGWLACHCERSWSKASEIVTHEIATFPSIYVITAQFICPKTRYFCSRF